MKLKKDILLIAGFLIVGIIFAGILLLTSREGTRIVVRVDGQEVTTLDLSEDQEYRIEGYQEGSNQLIIRDGEAWIEAATCPDKLCKGMGKIHAAGQSIVCLPNKVVIEILDNDSDSGTDIDIVTK